VSGQLCDPAALPLGKEPLNPLERRLNGPQACCTYGEKENLFLHQESKSGCHSQYSHCTDYEQLEVDKHTNLISKPQNSFRHQILLKERKEIE
jgi:hypothetical protein